MLNKGPEIFLQGDACNAKRIPRLFCSLASWSGNPVDPQGGPCVADLPPIIPKLIPYHYTSPNASKSRLLGELYTRRSAEGLLDIACVFHALD